MSAPKKRSEISYPPIGDYAYISDCHCCALISRDGSIDWCCMPRIDSGSCFGRLLDWEKGGYCGIHPTGAFQSSRHYLDNTLILETTFQTGKGRARLIDFFPMKEGGAYKPHQQIIRIIEGLSGEIELTVEIAPRFDYGSIKPWIKFSGGDKCIALGGNSGLMFSGNLEFEMPHRHNLRAKLAVRKNERFYLSIIFRKPEELVNPDIKVPSADELDRRLSDTISWWHSWVSKIKIKSPYDQVVRQSAIVLKGLSNAPTGAIAAAATTSLPESPGGMRNWDYRFSWIRDSAFTVRALAELGLTKEADGFRRFVERSAAGSADELQILFGVGGERRLHEYEITELEGYRKAKPVRIGNAAETQKQLDIYGELLDLAWIWHKRGHTPDDDYWEFLMEILEKVTKIWEMPDRGIWELRGEPRHFVQSKAMCWIALDKGIRLSKETGRPAPVEKWEKSGLEIRRAIEEKGYDSKRGIFTQAFNIPRLDSALLLLPIMGYIDHNDERMVRTVDAVLDELGADGLLYRYEPGSDELPGKEGVFLACSFWMAECLAHQNRPELAHKIFKKALGTGNDLRLFAEEYDIESNEMLGNFPQGLTHLSLISAAIALADMDRKRHQ